MEAERERICLCVTVLCICISMHMCEYARERADFAWALDNSLIDNYRTKIKAFVVCSCAAKRKH